MPEQSVRTDASTVLVPLRAAGDRYHAYPGYTPGNSPGAQARWRAALEPDTDEALRVAEIAGQLYRTRLLVRRDDSGLAYAQLDQRNLPFDVPADPPLPTAYRAYADQLRKECEFSEELTKDTRVSLSCSFIQPRFRLVSGDETKTVPWSQVNDHARVIITGAPGAGKTSALRRLALDLLAGAAPAPFGSPDEPGALPVLIQLRKFPMADFSADGIRRLINRERADELRGEVSAPLEGRRVVLLLDGLDEIAESDKYDEDQLDDDLLSRRRQQFLDRLARLCAEVPLIRVVLTSRNPLPTGALAGFTQLQMLPFEMPEIHEWTLSYASSHKLHNSRWARFIDLIRHDTTLRDLVGNPLLLALTASLHWRNPDELNDHTRLIGKYIHVLVQEWDAIRSVTRWRDSGVTSTQVERLLNELSFRHMRKADPRFTIEDVHTVVDELTGFTGHPVTLLEACQTSGMVRSTDGRHYFFAHQSLADYFAASHVVSQTAEVTGSIRDLSGQEDDRIFWRLTCGLTSNADHLLKAARKHGEDPDGVKGQQEQAEDERAAALMLGQALGEQISASLPEIHLSAKLVVKALKERLSEAQQVPRAAVEKYWSDRTDRKIVWVFGVAAEPGSRTSAEFKTSARLLGLVHRARAATVGAAGRALTDLMAASGIPLLEEAASALSETGLYHSETVPEGGLEVLYLAISQPTDTGFEE